MLPTIAAAPALIMVDVFATDSCGHELLGSFLLDPGCETADHRD